jgi:translocation and assembly module TamB
MSRRARRLWIVAGMLAALVLAVAIGAMLVLRSDWFSTRVRQRLVAEIEKATGGRAEIGAFNFDWRQMRVEVNGFVLHGTEPPDAPPLARADAIVLGIKVVSVMKRSVDLQYLDVRRPQVNLILYPDGRTNVPAPKIKRAGKSTAETILDLAIGRFSLQDGSFEVSGQDKTPFSAQGRNLRAQFAYDRAGPRYRGQLSIAPADFHWGGYQPIPLDVSLALAVEKNRVEIASGRVAAGESQAEFSGAIDSLTDLSGSFEYKVRASLTQVVRTLSLRTQLDGPVTLAGHLHFHGASDYQASGSLHAAGLLFHPDPHFTLRNFYADGAVNIDPRRIAVTGMRFSATAMAALTAADRPGGLVPFPVTGRMETVVLRQKTLDVGRIHIETLDGSFAGKGQIADLKHVYVEGDVAGFDVRKMMHVYNGQSVPWDAAASGPVQLNVDLGDSNSLRLTAHMAVSPVGPGAPVHGSIDAAYDGLSETLDLGNSSLALPSTNVSFSGVLGRQLRVHANSRNLDDVLPAFDIQSLPVKLRNGEAVFDGVISGNLDRHITGHGHATGVLWSGRVFDSLAGDIDLSGEGLTVRNGSVQEGALHLQGAGSLGMHDWSVDDSSAVSAIGSIRNAPVADLAAVADIKNIPLEGTLSAEGKITGAFGDPHIDAAVTVTGGVLEGEPFDRVTGTIAYSNTAVEMANAQLAAGARHMTFQAGFEHPSGAFASGHLRFHVDSNAMPLAEFRSVHKEYPGIGGTAELHAAGALDVAPAKPGEPGVRLTDLTLTLSGRGLQINEQALHDVALTAQTKGSELVAHLNSGVAGSVIQGDGKWSLAGDYPGNAQIDFKGLDLERLRLWLRGSKPPGGMQLSGFAEGTLSIAGPAIKPDLWKGNLRIPSLQIGPGGGLPNGKSLALHNAAPIAVSMERNAIRVESARMVGRTTDLSLSGTINLQQKSPLDLRVDGKFDLATLQDLVPEIYGSGDIKTGVAIRGPLAQPQIAGRLDIEKATFNLAEIPVGISNTNGVILFDGSRATIQSFSGESGGGTFKLSGFAGYDNDALVFRLHADAHEMRVRYPEDFSTVANASLSLTGGSDSSTLSGHISVLRTGFNPRSDFSSILAKSAEPVETPSVQTGLVANMHFDVQIDSAPDITFQSSLAQGIQAEASLRLRGTGSNPSLLGRINITQGQIVFFGTPFTINQGSIAFYNPVKIDPVLNLDLDTKARGIDVILNISGPINKLNLTPRSDPPMPFSDIVALLATGRSPTGDYATLMSSPASPQSLQQMGASALLGQAIASPVTGRLQRFFGVTRLKIDPSVTSLTGVENNPQARLTVEQQVTPEITFTYITDVTSTNPLVVQVEWAFSKHWSAVVLRDENGLVGLNFVYKTRFK